jgi:hypothetical protein
MLWLRLMFVYRTNIFLWTRVLSTKKAIDFSENLLGKGIVEESRQLVDCEDKIRIFAQKRL